MSSKLNLEVAKGNGFNEQNRFAVKFDIKNYDTSAVALSGLRVVAYSWLQYRNILSQFTSGTNVQGTLSKFTSAIDITNGVGQTGIVNLNLSDTTYRVYHNVVNSSKIAPQLTLNAPQGSSSYSTVVSYSNATDTYFDIVLNETLPTPGYTVTWFLPGSFDDYTGSTVNVGSPNLTIEKVSEYVRINNRKFDSRFIFSWTGNSNLINPSWGLKDTDVYVQLNPTLFPSSNITSAWYSSISDSILTDNPYYVLEQWNGSSWNTVQEYYTSAILDTLTGVVSTDSNFLKLVNTGSGNNKSTYISVNNINPISANASDRNNLSLWSKGNTDNRRRSLVKFETSAIPSSATGIKNAVLRLNVNSLSNAWNYFSTAGHIAVHRVTSDWIENQVTWSNRTSGSPWTTSGGDYDTTPAIWLGSSELSNSFTSADQTRQFWVDFDVTSFVNYWRLNPSENYGVLIKLYNSSNENNSTDIKWELNSGRLAGTGAISGFPQLLISYNSLNNEGEIPLVEIKSPENNSTVFNTTFSISGIASISSGQVEGVDVYYRPANSVSPYQTLGGLGNVGLDSWVGSFSSLPEGTYEFILRAVSDYGNFGESLPILISFISSPEVYVESDSFCHNGSITVQGTIDTSFATPLGGTLSYATKFIPTDKKITSIIHDRLNSGVIWVSTDGNGIYRIDKNSQTDRVVSFNTTNSSISFDRVKTLSMDSQGILWIGYISNGVGLFDTKNWNVRNFSDWTLFDSTNSSLSAYPANAIEVNDITIDSNNVKWLTLTYQSSFSVIKLSGYSFNDTYATKYDINATPRSVAVYGSNVYVSTTDNRLFKFNGSSWSNYILPTFNTINDIDVDSNGVVWLATNTGFASFSATTFTELQYSATNFWPNGLKSDDTILPNVQAKSVFVDSNNTKWISFSTGVNGEYNGGFVKYDRNTIDQIGIDSNLKVYDSKNYSGILSDNVYDVIVSGTDIWVATERGVSLFDNDLWEMFSKDTVSYDLIMNGGTFSTIVTEPLFGGADVEYKLEFDYASGEKYNQTVYIPSTQSPTVDIKYPTKDFNPISSNARKKIIEYKIPDSDAKFGSRVITNIKKSSSISGPWYTAYSYENKLNFPLYETLIPEEFYYIKVESINDLCVSESIPFAIYGANPSTVNLDSIAGQKYSSDVIRISGNVYNKDFLTPVILNGNQYIDSLTDVDIGYTTSAGFNSIGKAILDGSNFYIDWSSPIPGVSSLSAIATSNYGTVGIGQVTFSSIISRPTILITSPTENQIIKLQSPFVLSATTAYLSNQVSALSYHITTQTGVSSVSASTTGNGVWTRSINPSAYGSGPVSISATCVDIVNVSAQSNSTNFNINTLPSVLQLSNLTETHTGTYSFQIRVNDVNGFYNNKVEIISAGSIYTSGYANGFGDYTWNWLNPPNGIRSLSAKIYDGNPTLSSDYYVYAFQVNLNTLSGSINSFAYPSAKFNSVTISPKVNVVRTDTLITPSLTTIGSNISGVNYWLCDYDEANDSYYKKQNLSSSFYLPSSRKYINQTESKYNFWGVLAEIVSTNGSTYETDITKFYVKEQSVDVDIFNNTCTNPIIFSGSYLDSDSPLSRSNTIIDNSVSANFYNETNNAYLGELIPNIRATENIDYFYYWNNPSSAVSAVSVRLVDSYGLSATKIINFGGIEVEPTISLLSATSFIRNIGDIYLVSAGNYNVSALTSATKIKDIHFVHTVSGIATEISANVNKVGTVVIPQLSAANTIYAYLKTSGNCEAYSWTQTVIPVLPISANIYPDNCSTCFCNGGRLKITGSVFDPNYGGDLEAYFTRSISAYIYDNFNNLISDISSQIVNGVGSFETYWETPAVGATSVYIKVVDNNGVVQTISRQLQRSIYSSPILNLISPIDYSISGTIYRQDNAITFESAISSDDLLGVKYYVDGQLVSTANASNGFRYDWTIDKLPGIYSVSAVAINSNGCYSIVSKNIMVSNVPVTNFIYPVSGNYYQVGTQLSAAVDSKGNLPATVSAVSVKFAGSTFNTVYNSDTRYWETPLSVVSSLQLTYALSAFSYDTLGRTAIKEIIINASTDPIFFATVSGSTSVSANYNTAIPLFVWGFSPNGVDLQRSYADISGTIVEIPKSNTNEFSLDLLIPLYFGPGNNTIIVYVVDEVGAKSSRTISLYVNPFTGVVSYPVIRNIGSSPMNKVTYRG